MAFFGAGGMASYIEEQKRRGRKTDSRTLRRVALAFRPYTFQVILVVLAVVVTTVLGLVNPLLIQHIFDDAIGKRNLPLLLIYVGVMCLIPIISGIVVVGQTYLNNTIGQKVMRDLRNQLYRHLQSMPLRLFTATRTGEIQSRLTNDVGGLQSVVTNTATSILTNLSTVLSTLIAMIIISPMLSLLTIALLPLFLWVTHRVGIIRRETSKKTQQRMASLTAIVQETLSVSGILLMKSFGRELYSAAKFSQENQRLTDLEIRQQMIGRWFFMFTATFFSILPALVYLIAGWQIIQSTSILGAGMTLGTIVSFTTLQSRLLLPLSQLLNIQIEIQGSLALFDRIFEYLDLPSEITDKPDALHLQASEGKGIVEFKNVSFAYKRDAAAARESTAGVRPPFLPFALGVSPANEESKGSRPPFFPPVIVQEEKGERITLQNISFAINPGQLVALVGASGAGKTTITYLVPRFYDVDSGSVEIDGHNVKDIALASLAEMIGMVTQETYLFHASIRENLLYGRLDASEEEMIAAAKAAAIHDRILEFDDGYDTIVGERGYKLSGGEKQRVAIARVILKNPRILILDEATSALDTHSERLIQAALNPLMKGRTTLAIAHRLSTILAADLILVMDKGKIVERGTHQELLSQGGAYAKLYAEQFSRMPQEKLSM